MTLATRSKPTSALPSFQIRHLTEDEIEAVVLSAGGQRAHPDADKRSLRGADFVLGSSVIELKILEDEGLDKPERQRKLAKFFREKFPSRPTIVLDRGILDLQGQRSYDRIVEGPIKTAVSSAKQQLQQSKKELKSTGTVLWVINNGYSSLSHDAVLKLVVKRTRNDTSDIDVVIVSGAYFFSDTFDSFFLWPIDCVPINLDKPFEHFDALKEAWDAFAMERMNALMRDSITAKDTKGPVVDLSFCLDGVTYVMPTPPIGSASDFFANGRPRINSTGITISPKVATVFAGLNLNEWRNFNKRHPNAVSPSYADWSAMEDEARASCDLKPFATPPVKHADWFEWARKQPKGKSLSVHQYANDLFQKKIMAIIEGARERTQDSVLPTRYMLLITEEIGQDLAFDVSRLAEVYTGADDDEYVKEVWADKSMFFHQALVVAAAEGASRDIEYVFWNKDKTYVWR